jgi:hypothetical protein
MLLLVQVFRGSLQSNLTCRSCGHESIKQEAFLDLSLSLTRCGPVASSPLKPVPSTTSALQETVISAQTPLPVPTPETTQSSSSTAFGQVTEDIAAVDVAPVVAPALPRTRGRKAKNAAAAQTPAVPVPPVLAPPEEPVPVVPIVPPPEPEPTLPPASAPSAETGSTQAAATSATPAGVSAPAADQQDAEEIALSDCLRSFTTLENLGEKIVSYRRLSFNTLLC